MLLLPRENASGLPRAVAGNTTRGCRKEDGRESGLSDTLFKIATPQAEIGFIKQSIIGVITLICQFYFSRTYRWICINRDFRDLIINSYDKLIFLILISAPQPFNLIKWIITKEIGGIAE